MKAPKGFLLAGMHCGIKKKKPDLGLIYCDGYAQGCAFFTQNANPSYSVMVSKENIRNKVKALLVNSGNANCFSSSEGLRDTRTLCKKLAAAVGAKSKNVLIASTGIIGKKLPVARIAAHLDVLFKKRGRSADMFSKSIVTTDTFEKKTYRKMKYKGKEISIIGCAKGAGMIYPNMATMLAFILTDANVSRSTLKKISARALENSFNSITIDGCMSTNDTVYVLSSRASGPLLDAKQQAKFSRLLDEVCLDLAKKIVQDAEGATKFITLTVRGARTQKEAKAAAFAIANSVLFKTAMFGNNPNWGRIVQALGQIGIAVKEKSIKMRAGSLKKKNIALDVFLGRGTYKKTVYTSDLTPQYVKINAGYS